MLCDTVRGISKNTVQVPLNLHTIFKHQCTPLIQCCSFVMQRWGVTLADDFVPSAATTEYTSFLLRAAEHEVSAHVVGC